MRFYMERDEIAPIEYFLLTTDDTVCIGAETDELYKRINKLERARLNEQSVDPDEYVEVSTLRSRAIADNSCTELIERQTDRALLNFFHKGPVGHLNPYYFLARGVSYIQIIPIDSPEFDRAKYKKRLLGGSDQND